MATPRPSLADLDPELGSIAEAILRDHGVPGAAIAVVVPDGEFLDARGRKRFDRPDPVTARTAFNVGSNTKAFVSTAVAILEDEGRLRWDDPIVRWIEELSTPDPWVTEHLTLRDLSANRSGLARCGLLELATDLTISASEVFRRLRFAEVACGFRERFTYLNIGHTAVANAVGRAAGTSFLGFLEERVLRPLGMNDSSGGASARARLDDLASWHCQVDGRTVALDPVFTDVYLGAGGLCVSGADALRWLRFQLCNGAIDGRAIVSERALAETHAPQIVVRADELAPWIGTPDTLFAAYALGWAVSELGGQRVLRHSGSDFGVNAQVALVPEEGIGVAVYINNDSRAALVLSYTLLATLLGLPARDWRALVTDPALPDTNAGFRMLRDRDATAVRPALAEESYAGHYFHPGNGEAEVSLHDPRRLVVRFPVGDLFSFDLVPVGGHRFVTRPHHPGLASDGVGAYFSAEFEITAGTPAALAIPGIGRFERVAREHRAAQLEPARSSEAGLA